MRVLIATALIISTPALAQAPAGDALPVPLTAQERNAILNVCAAGLWAQRQNFDGVCDYLRLKFEGVEREAKAKAEADKSETQKDKAQ